MARPQMHGICPKCGKQTKMTRHHVYPRFLFGRANNHEILWICRDCHTKIDEIVCKEIKLPKPEYLRITMEWLRGGNPVICAKRKHHKRSETWRDSELSMTGW